MAKQEKKKPTDLLARAREEARRELEALRPEPEKPVKQTLLTGFGRFNANLP
ncbi:hypothetical protein ES708_08616 [subsurface metagenome]